MRLPADAGRRLAVLGLAVALAGCAVVRGDDRLASLSAAAVRNGPAQDYPVVLGEPFAVEGELYTPADTLNYDEVGYAALDPQAPAGITAAHKTLPLPSYVEITALDTGKTILARVERRGPMTGVRLVALSSDAQAQLGIGDGAPVRVRRVNPPEVERAELRAGRAAVERMETPKSLADVLRRKLPGAGAGEASAVARPHAREPERIAQVSPTPATSQGDAPGAKPAQVLPERPGSVTAYPLPPLAVETRPAARAPVSAPRPGATGGFVVQAATFASKANADRAAAQLGGIVSPAGKYFRVRTGPVGTRGQADAALAKVRAAGYSDARVLTAG